jgi:inorganic pyrophosphatase/exopolyphosphatase
MEMNNIKFANVKQAKYTHEYKNVKEKLHKMNADIWFNKMCKAYNVTPKYINIKVSGKNKQSQNTLQTAVKYRITQELKFLCTKKHRLSEQVYHLHLLCATDCQKL